MIRGESDTHSENCIKTYLGRLLNIQFYIQIGFQFFSYNSTPIGLSNILFAINLT